MSEYLMPLLNEINQVINANLKLDQLLDGVLEKLQPSFSYTAATISLWDSKLGQLVVQSYAGSTAQLGDVLSPEGCFAAHIVREREPLLLSDSSKWPEWEGGSAVQSYVGVPLLARSDLVGTLELFSDQAGAFSAETLEALNVVARQVALAVENVRLYNETLARADEIAALNTLAAGLTASLNLDELLEIVVYSVGQVIGCDRAAVFVMDNERSVLNLVKSRGLSGEYIRTCQNLKPELGGRAQVILDRYPLVVSDIRQTRFSSDLVASAEREGFNAFADVPLRGREHVLGALTVYYDRPHTFDEAELDLLTTFANQLTLALENARLYERTDQALARRMDQLAAIEEIGRELTSTLDLNRVFDLLLQRAMGSTGASAGLLALCESDCDDLELIADRGYPAEVLQPYRVKGWPKDHGILGRVVRSGETALVNDVRADPNYVSLLRTACAQLVVPIIKERRVLGVVSLESSRSQGFSLDDARFTTQLAELAAIAIDNARLFHQVRAGRDNLQAILDSTRDGILVIDRDTRVVLVNPMIEEMSGLSAQSLIGRRVRAVVAELGNRVPILLGYPDGHIEEVLSFLESMSDQVSRRVYEVPGSSISHIEQEVSPVINRDGVVVGRLFVFRDITERRRVEQMRQELTDMIIHDLRSPLTAVVGGLQVAGDLLDTSADPATIHYALDTANESCDRVMALADSLLEISRLEAKQMPLERQPVLLSQLAQSVIKQMTPLAEREMVELQLETGSQIPPVEADYELISRVLVNLVDNALKHSPSNGTVTISIVSEPNGIEQHRSSLGRAETSLSQLPFSYPPAEQNGLVVRCTVLDMGPGVPVEYRETIFRRFAQLGDRRRGMGLGLAFCRLAVQAHGGRIWITDNPSGQGSAFNFTLPIMPPQMWSLVDLGG